MIPTVKSWQVTTEDGTRYVVLAPTRYLARLNFRYEIGFQPIRSIGRLRSTGGSPA